jgi:hypothetical protein
LQLPYLEVSLWLLSEKHFALVVVTFLSQVGDFWALLCVCFAVSEEGRAWKTDVKWLVEGLDTQLDMEDGDEIDAMLHQTGGRALWHLV